MKNRGQSIVEFAFVVPLIVILIFSIIEFAMYWMAVNNVQGIAQSASAKMSITYVSESVASNAAVNKALLLIVDKAKILGENLTFQDKSDASEISSRPFAVYKYESLQTRSTTSGVKPIMTVIVDFSNPYKDGIVLKLYYQYRTILLGASIPFPGKKSLVIIPRDIKIVSKQTQQYSSY